MTNNDEHDTITRNKGVHRRHTTFIIANPIAATCSGCKKQP